MSRYLINHNDNMTKHQCDLAKEYLWNSGLPSDYFHCLRLIDICSHISNYQEELEDYRNDCSSKHSPIGK
jgi:hypothetical protein